MTSRGLTMDLFQATHYQVKYDL